MATIEPTIQKCLYVDDLLLSYSAPFVHDIQKAINEINMFALSRGFWFFRPKTKLVNFCRLRCEHNEPILNINDIPIENVDSMKFFGLILDKKLTYKENIKHLETKCKSTLNALRCLSSTRWGAEKEILKTIYKTLIWSTIYSSARPSLLKVLDLIQNTGLRLTTGAFRTSPIRLLEVEAGIPPFL